MQSVATDAVDAVIMLLKYATAVICYSEIGGSDGGHDDAGYGVAARGADPNVSLRRVQR